jgi:hypothetical protein
MGTLMSACLCTCLCIYGSGLSLSEYMYAMHAGAYLPGGLHTFTGVEGCTLDRPMPLLPCRTSIPLFPSFIECGSVCTEGLL